MPEWDLSLLSFVDCVDCLTDRGVAVAANTRYLILAVNLCWVLTTPAPLRRARTTLFTLVALSLLLEKCLCDDADRMGTVSLVGRSGLVGRSHLSVGHAEDACCRVYNVMVTPPHHTSLTYLLYNMATRLQAKQRV